LPDGLPVFTEEEYPELTALLDQADKESESGMGEEQCSSFSRFSNPHKQKV
jgi:hypothetical protein